MKNFTYFATMLTVFCWLVCRPAQLAAQNKENDSPRLSVPHYQEHFSALDIPYSGVRVWDKGYLISYAFDGTFQASPNKPAVVLYDREGRLARQAIVWFKDAEGVSIGDVAVSKTGKLLIAGGTHNHGGVVANFIAEIDDSGHVGRVIRTTPFRPVYICAADDGTVWSYGFERDEEGKRVGDSLMLRQYSFDKGQLRAKLSRSALNSSGWTLSDGRYPGDISLRCTSREVGLYNASSGEWIQFDISTGKLKVSQVVPLPPAKEMRITGFSLTEAGDVFASMHDRLSKPPRSGLFRLSFDGSGVGHWGPVGNTLGPFLHGAAVGQLLGADGSDLVYTRDLDDVAYWSKYTK